MRLLDDAPGLRLRFPWATKVEWLAVLAEVEARRAGSAVDVAEDASRIAKVGMGREPKVGRKATAPSTSLRRQVGRTDAKRP